MFARPGDHDCGSLIAQFVGFQNVLPEMLEHNCPARIIDSAVRCVRRVFPPFFTVVGVRRALPSFLTAVRGVRLDLARFSPAGWQALRLVYLTWPLSPQSRYLFV